MIGNKGVRRNGLRREQGGEKKNIAEKGFGTIPNQKGSGVKKKGTEVRISPRETFLLHNFTVPVYRESRGETS